MVCRPVPNMDRLPAPPLLWLLLPQLVDHFRILTPGHSLPTHSYLPPSITLAHTLPSTDHVPGCENAQLVSALDSEDTGTINYLNSLYQLPDDMVRAAFGDADLNTEQLGKGIPPVGTGSVLGSEECLKRCNLVRK